MNQKEVSQKPDWVDSITQLGLKPVFTSEGHCWIRTHKVVQMRYPPNDLAPVTETERREVFRLSRALVLTHHSEAADQNAMNGVLYMLRDSGYDLDKLSANNRSKVRRGLKRHEVRRITPQELAETGYQCQADSRRRNGITPPDPTHWREHWSRFQCPAHYELWGAMADGELAAFMVVLGCGRWVEMVSSSSCDKHLRDYPNHALFYTVMSEMIHRPGVESVSYGLSTVEVSTRAESLHQFKLSVGLEAIPVTRQFHVAAVLKALVNPVTLRAARLAETCFPSSMAVRKTRGMLEELTGHRPATIR